MGYLESISSPEDLKGLDTVELPLLAEEIRGLLIQQVSRTGGHLGPNLGMVEVTIALHRAFDSPRDAIVFDTGHQSYVHKLLTGRGAGFASLRQAGGLSGYPSRAESEHDWVENSHASTSLSWAEGLARAFRLRGEDRHAVAVIGDGALTGGMAWEALNNIAVAADLPLVIVVNDNGRSYTPTVGGLATQLQGLGEQLTAIRTDRRYEPFLQWVKRMIRSIPGVGEVAYGLMHGFKSGVKDVLVPNDMFSDLGLKYIGPINGHDIHAVEVALHQARGFGGPVLVHCLTTKGKGFKAAEEDEADRFHAIGRIDEVTGEPLAAGARTWTDAFSDELVSLGAEDERVVAITAAMLNPTGLGEFAARFPDRTFDVGIAEQHAVTMASGLATGGLRPVVALYSTFLNRAFDQVLMDAALHRAPVTIVLDRAGVTGPDGPSHDGMWDTSLMGLVPRMRLAAPRDGSRLAEALKEAVGREEGPTVIRYSKQALPAVVDRVGRHGSVDLISTDPGAQVLLVGYGEFVRLALAVADQLRRMGVSCTVADPVWALPVSEDLVELAAAHSFVATVEDGGLAGGLGSRLALEASLAGIQLHLRPFGLPAEFLAQGQRSEILADLGLSAEAIAAAILAWRGSPHGSQDLPRQAIS